MDDEKVEEEVGGDKEDMEIKRIFLRTTKKRIRNC